MPYPYHLLGDFKGHISRVCPLFYNAWGSGLVGPRERAPYMQPVERGLFGQAAGDSCAALAYDVGCEEVCLGAADWDHAREGLRALSGLVPWGVGGIAFGYLALFFELAVSASATVPLVGREFRGSTALVKPLIFIERFSSAVSASTAVLLGGRRVQVSAVLPKPLFFITGFLLAGSAAVEVLPAETNSCIPLTFLSERT